MSWAAYRSAAKAYAIRSALGAALAGVFGLGADLSEAHETAAPLVHSRPFGATLFGATIGCLAGLIYYRLRWMRDRGGVYWHFSWGLSAAGAMALYALPETLRTGEWLAYVLIVAFSLTAGFGMGAFILLIYIKSSERDDKGG